MEQTKQNSMKVLDIAMVGVFAAITFLGIQIFRIPIGFTPGVPFVHFGNIFLLLGALLLGPKKGTIAGALGYTLFDILNGYIQVLPKAVGIAILMCIAASLIFRRLKDRIGRTGAILAGCTVAFLISLAGDFLYELAMLMLGGSQFAAAATTAFVALFATAFNAVFALIAIPILYPLLSGAMKRARIVPYAD